MTTKRAGMARRSSYCWVVRLMRSTQVSSAHSQTKPSVSPGTSWKRVASPRMRSLIARNMTSFRARRASSDGMPPIQSRAVDTVALGDVTGELELRQCAADVAGRAAGGVDELVDRRRQVREQLVVDRILARREAVGVEHVGRARERRSAEL